MVSSLNLEVNNNRALYSSPTAKCVSTPILFCLISALFSSFGFFSPKSPLRMVMWAVSHNYVSCVKESFTCSLTNRVSSWCSTPSGRDWLGRSRADIDVIIEPRAAIVIGPIAFCLSNRCRAGRWRLPWWNDEPTDDIIMSMTSGRKCQFICIFSPFRF